MRGRRGASRVAAEAEEAEEEAEGQQPGRTAQGPTPQWNADAARHPTATAHALHTVQGELIPEKKGLFLKQV